MEARVTPDDRTWFGMACLKVACLENRVIKPPFTAQQRQFLEELGQLLKEESQKQ